MVICRACGSSIGEDSIFCPECGARQAPPAEGGQPASPAGAPPSGGPRIPPAYGGPRAAAPPKKPMSARTKVLLGVAAGLIVAAVAAVLILRHVFSPENTIDTFLESVREQDYEAFSQLVDIDSDTFTLTAESAAPFLALYSQEGWLEELRGALTASLTAGTGSIFSQQDPYPSDSPSLFRLEETDYWVFSAYRVVISPITQSFWCNLETATLSLGGQTAAITGGEASLQLLPGQYDWTATAPGLSSDLTADGTGAVYTRDGTQEISFTYSGLEVEAIDWELASVTINGAAYTGELNTGEGFLRLSPLQQGDRVEVSYQAGPYTLTDATVVEDAIVQYFRPDPQLPQEAADAALEVLGSYIPQLVAAVNAGDGPALAALTEGVDNGFLTSEIYHVTQYGWESGERWYSYDYTITQFFGDRQGEAGQSGGSLTFRTRYYVALTGSYSSPYSTYDVEDDYGGYAILTYDGAQGAWVLSEVWTSWWYGLEDLTEPVDLM